jgi:hypothetical protein
MISNIFLNTVKFISQNLKLVTIGILGFFVLSSKHFIIYNEETLVVISFIAFVIFSYRMLNQSIENSLKYDQPITYIAETSKGSGDKIDLDSKRKSR